MGGSFNKNSGERQKPLKDLKRMSISLFSFMDVGVTSGERAPH